MTKLLLILLLAVPAYAGGKSRPKPVSSPSAIPVSSPSPVPGGPIKVLFDPVTYYSSPAERVKITAAGKKVNEVLQSKCFADFMAKQPLKWTNGRTPTQVVEHLQGLTGTVPVHMYYRCMSFGLRCPVPTSAVAYRPVKNGVGLNEIWLNQAAFWTGMSDCEWANTLAHEGVGHLLGDYDHDYEWTREREDTVPYVMGGRKDMYGSDAFAKCCK